MEVKVVNETAPCACSEADYVRVEMWSDPEQDTVTLATIERVVKKSNVKPCSSPRRIKRLIHRQPMTPDDAVGFATRYAESKKIPLVLTATPTIRPAR